MMETLNTWLEHWEPLWLAGILFYEGLVGTLTLAILVIEYHYDKKHIESSKEEGKHER